MSIEKRQGQFTPQRLASKKKIYIYKSTTNNLPNGDHSNLILYLNG